MSQQRPRTAITDCNALSALDEVAKQRSHTMTLPPVTPHVLRILLHIATCYVCKVALAKFEETHLEKAQKRA